MGSFDSFGDSMSLDSMLNIANSGAEAVEGDNTNISDNSVSTSTVAQPVQETAPNLKSPVSNDQTIVEQVDNNVVEESQIVDAPKRSGRPIYTQAQMDANNTVTPSEKTPINTVTSVGHVVQKTPLSNSRQSSKQENKTQNNNNISLENITKIINIEHALDKIDNKQEVYNILLGKQEEYSLPQFIYSVLNIDDYRKQEIMVVIKVLGLDDIEKPFYLMDLDESLLYRLDSFMVGLFPSHNPVSKQSGKIVAAKNIMLSMCNMDDNIKQVLQTVTVIMENTEKI